MNSKYLEKLIQEEYQKIIQEQDDTKKPAKELTPNQAGGLNSKTCICNWNVTRYFMSIIKPYL